MEVGNIPAELRWQIATKSANIASAALDMAFREAVGDEVVNQIQNMLMAEGGKQAGATAKMLELPSANAAETSKTWEIISSITLGPEIESYTTESSEDRIVDQIKSCPMLNAHNEIGAPLSGTPEHCQTYNTNAVESINPRYTQYFTKRMCTGDEYCESILELK
jgi:hypothetical protein